MSVAAVVVVLVVIRYWPFGDNADNNVNQTNQTAISPNLSLKISDQVAGETNDQDGDGLTDEEEQALGTDITKVDSDDDLLFDSEELNIYQTDPLNPDTDSDGLTDGEEVKKRLNPKGPGPLVDLSQAISDS
ncbi:MAG: hypothetical protein V1853_01405 [bacterium]